MSVVTDRFPSEGPSAGAKVRAVLAALAITVVAFVAGVVGLLFWRPVLSAVGEIGAVLADVTGTQGIQIGFAAFAAAYLYRYRDWDRYVRVRWPTVEDVAWMVGILLLLEVSGPLLSPVLAAVGLPEPHSGGGGGDVTLAAAPLIWAATLGWQFLFAAPAEELVYRGIVQGRLRGSFGTAGVVALGGLLFGFMHLLVGLLTPDVALAAALNWGISAVLPGLIWGLAYERTENLAVTALTHALTWTAADEVLVQLLPP